jgi:hypothetical protein
MSRTHLLAYCSENFLITSKFLDSVVTSERTRQCQLYTLCKAVVQCRALRCREGCKDQAIK